MKRSSSWIAVLPSLVIPVCIGLMMYLGLSYLIQEGSITNETVLRYLTGHPVSKVTVGMFFIGIASLALIANNVFDQFGSERKITIQPEFDPNADLAPNATLDPAEELDADASQQPDSNGPVGDQAVELGKRLRDLPSSMHEHYLWQRLVNALHSIYRTNSTNNVEEELKYLADLDLDRQQQRYSLVRILIWATPMLGFLGTVLGISQALGGISVGPDNNFQQMMDGLRGSLYIAFDTTALALTLSMVMMFGQFLVERFESQLLELVDQRAKHEIASQFDLTVSTTETTYENIAREFLDASRESIENQTESWRKTIRSAEEAWTLSLSQANTQAQSNLSEAIDESVSNLASCLGAAIDKADTSMSHRWGQWQVTLSDNARLMATYQGQLSEQTELIHKLLEQSKTKEVFQPAIDQNEIAVEATSQLRQSLAELASAIAELKQETAAIVSGSPQSAEAVSETMPAPKDLEENESAAVAEANSETDGGSTEVIFEQQMVRRESVKMAPIFFRSHPETNAENNIDQPRRRSFTHPVGQSDAEVILPIRLAATRDSSNRTAKKAA